MAGDLHPVSNYLATEDQYSRGWEFEFAANPTKNWRVSVNATKTEAMRQNFGGASDSALAQFVELTNKYQNTGFDDQGDLRSRPFVDGSP